MAIFLSWFFSQSLTSTALAVSLSPTSLFKRSIFLLSIFSLRTFRCHWSVKTVGSLCASSRDLSNVHSLPSSQASSQKPQRSIRFLCSLDTEYLVISLLQIGRASCRERV